MLTDGQKAAFAGDIVWAQLCLEHDSTAVEMLPEHVLEDMVDRVCDETGDQEMRRFRFRIRVLQFVKNKMTGAMPFDHAKFRDDVYKELCIQLGW